MARNDIVPVVYAGSSNLLVYPFPLNASETFLRGEPVAANADGELTESADDPVDADLLGIAAEDGDTTNADGLSFQRSPFGQFTDTGLLQTGDLINVWIPTHTALFATTNFSTDGAAFGGTFATTQRGDRGGLSLISGSWGFDTAASNFTCRLLDILNAQGRSISLETGSTGITVLFTISAMQLNTFGDLDAPVA